MAATIFDLIKIISDKCAIKPEKIKPDSKLVADLGIGGDDGYEHRHIGMACHDKSIALEAGFSAAPKNSSSASGQNVIASTNKIMVQRVPPNTSALDSGA